jgi:hypothetical protein
MLQGEMIKMTPAITPLAIACNFGGCCCGHLSSKLHPLSNQHVRHHPHLFALFLMLGSSRLATGSRPAK